MWRLTYDGMPRDRTQPRMLTETPAQLVTHLAHPNGWWRDTAQQLLVLKQDRSVVPALQRMARTRTNLLARFHALWTLEGLGALDAALVREAMSDPEPRMRIQAIRASESLYKAGDKSFAADWRTLAEDKDADVVIQAMLTMNLLKVPDTATTVKLGDGRPQGERRAVRRRAHPEPASRAGGGGRGGAALTPEQQASLARGANIYTELCFSCHGEDGRGTPAPGGARGRDAGAIVRRIAAGQRPSRLRHQAAPARLDRTARRQDVPRRSWCRWARTRDQWVADVSSYIRTSFGNVGSPVRPPTSRRARERSRAGRPRGR